MPTPTGLLRVGERLRHTATGTTATVVSRSGTDPRNYTVTLRRSGGVRQVTWVLEMPFWLEHGWELVGK